MKYYAGPWQWNDAPGIGSHYAAPVGAIALIDLRTLETQSSVNHSGGVGNGFFATPDDVSLDADYSLLGQGYITEVTTNASVASTWQSLFGVTPEGDRLIDYLAYTLTDGSDPQGTSGPMPLMSQSAPTEASIVLAGHSVVWSRRPNIRSGTSRWEQNCRSVIKSGLNASVKSGGGQWRKELGWVKEKFGQRWDDPDDSWLLTNEMQQRGRGAGQRSFARKPSSSAIETWPGSNGAITSGRDLGWSFHEGADIMVVSNRSANGSTFTGWSRARMTTAMSGTDLIAQIEYISRTGALSSFGTEVRKDSNDATQTYYMAQWYVGDIYSQKIVAATPTTLGTYAVSPSANDLLKCKANGSTIEAIQNTTSRVSVTDTAITTGTYCGIGHFSNSHIATCDNWYCEDISSATARPDLGLLLGVS